jgi:uncharacterized Zn finger protein (UPF0148 family)
LGLSCLWRFLDMMAGRIVGGHVMPDIEYTVSGLFNKVVKFNCPHCKIPLTTLLKYAGKVDQCPQCGGEFLNPGREILEQKAALEAEEKAQKESEAAAKAAGRVPADKERLEREMREMQVAEETRAQPARQLHTKPTILYPANEQPESVSNRFRNLFLGSTLLIASGLFLVIVGGICEGAALNVLHSGQPGAQYDVYPYYVVAIPTLVSGSLLLIIGAIAKGVTLGIKEDRTLSVQSPKV